jgi:hypothetical protein
MSSMQVDIYKGLEKTAAAPENYIWSVIDNAIYPAKRIGHRIGNSDTKDCSSKK